MCFFIYNCMVFIYDLRVQETHLQYYPCISIANEHTSELPSRN